MTAKTSKPQLRQIEFGKRVIPYTLELRNRKRLSITVHPDKTVTVLAPADKDLDDVLQRIWKRRLWIVKQQEYFQQFQPLPQEKLYVSGETHRYLGRQYRLKLHKNDDEFVKLIGRYIHIHLNTPEDNSKAKEALESWYRAHAEPIFEKRLDSCFNLSKSMKVPRPTLKIRRMQTRWGSCSKTGTITLNTELVKTPVYCIEYVIMHELCHLRIRNHTPAFYQLLSRYMPDWKTRKKRLDSFVI